MPELSPEFQSIPEEYQHLIRLAQDAYAISVAPLQLLVGGWSGAIVYLVSVSYNETGSSDLSMGDDWAASGVLIID